MDIDKNKKASAITDCRLRDRQANSVYGPALVD